MAEQGFIRILADAQTELAAEDLRQGLSALSLEELRNRAIGALTPDSELAAQDEVIDGIDQDSRTRPTRLERVETVERDLLSVTDYMLAHPEEFGSG